MNRVTINPETCFGKPVIRNTRYSVESLLSLMSASMTSDEILADYEDLTAEDLQACLS